MILPLEELLLLDWLYCGQGEKATDQLLDHMMRWTDLRERVWRAVLLAKLTNGEQKPLAEKMDLKVPIEISRSECLELLAVVPTTFRWGTGADVGFNLKMRLADEVWGAEERERYEGLAKMRALYGGQDASSPSDHPGEDLPKNPTYDES